MYLQFIYCMLFIVSTIYWACIWRSTVQ